MCKQPVAAGEPVPQGLYAAPQGVESAAQRAERLEMEERRAIRERLDKQERQDRQDRLDKEERQDRQDRRDAIEREERRAAAERAAAQAQAERLNMQMMHAQTIAARPQPVVAPLPVNNNNTTTTVVINNGQERIPVNHVCHFICCLATSGLTLPCWIAACAGCCCEKPCGCC